MILYNGNEWTTQPYDAALLAVVVGGVTICNPTRTPDDSEFCTPARYGFQVVATGGGCMAWRLDIPNGDYLLVTDAGGAYLPQPDDDDSPMIGRYNAEDEGLALVDDFRELPKNGGAL